MERANQRGVTMHVRQRETGLLPRFHYSTEPNDVTFGTPVSEGLMSARITGLAERGHGG
ncbi:MAG: hypothetical protein U9N79_11255 [Actinomycetota bacterium]|nr:hypothetical protein [Actinomycetota bacterium]